MFVEAKHILALITLILFVCYMLFVNSPRKGYIIFVLLFLPFVDLNLTTEYYGSITIFDAISYLTFFLLIRSFIKSSYNNEYFYLIATLVLFLVIGSLMSEFIRNSLFNLLKFASVFVFAKLLIDECSENSNFTRTAVNCLKVSFYLSIVFVLIQIIVGLRFTFYTDLNPNIFDSNSIRYPSFFQDPQTFAQFLSMSCFLFLLRFPGDKPILNYLSFLLVILTLFFTGGRSSFLGLCAGLVLIFFSSKNKFRYVLVVCGIVAYFLALNFSEYLSLFNRQENLNEAYLVRDRIWKEAYTMFLQKPIWGIGIGNYHEHIVSHSSGGFYIIDGEIVYHGAESGYLKLLVECGLPGFVMIFLVIAKPIITLFKNIRAQVWDYNTSFLLASVLCWAISFSSLYTLSDKRIVLLLTIVVTFLTITSKRKDFLQNAQFT